LIPGRDLSVTTAEVGRNNQLGHGSDFIRLNLKTHDFSALLSKV